MSHTFISAIVNHHDKECDHVWCEDLGKLNQNVVGVKVKGHWVQVGGHCQGCHDHTHEEDHGKTGGQVCQGLTLFVAFTLGLQGTRSVELELANDDEVNDQAEPVDSQNDGVDLRLQGSLIRVGSGAKVELQRLSSGQHQVNSLADQSEYDRPQVEQSGPETIPTFIQKF